MKKKTSISIDADLRKIATEYAEEQSRSLSNFVEHLLKAELKRRGVEIP